jgi:hypothetical protein
MAILTLFSQRFFTTGIQNDEVRMKTHPSYLKEDLNLISLDGLEIMRSYLRYQSSF